jgi:hypothetical protein
VSESKIRVIFESLEGEDEPTFLRSRFHIVVWLRSSIKCKVVRFNRKWIARLSGSLTIHTRYTIGGYSLDYT